MKVSIEADEEDHPCERVASAITAAAGAIKDIAGGFFGALTGFCGDSEVFKG